MATLLLARRPFLTPFSITLGLSTAFAAHTFSRPRLVYCDSAAAPVSDSLRTYTRDAKVPVVKNGRPNPAAYKQISSGSILGLLGGIAVGTFSKTLAFLFGLLVFGLQFAASRGYSIIPVSRLQHYVKSFDLRSAVEDNVAFKLSFGATFMLATFADL